MAVTILITMCVINLILWIVFFIKFKSLFSTDDVLQKTREQVGQLISEVNGTTLANINLIDSKIEELNDAIENAERRIKAADIEQTFRTSKKAAVISEEKQSSKIPPKETKKRSARVSNINVASKVIEQDEAFEVKINKKTASKTLKASEKKEEEKPDLPNIYMSKNPIKAKRNFQERVVELYNLGYSIEKIAKETERSTTEVQFVIDML